MILATWQGFPASLLQGGDRKGVHPDGCCRPGTGRVAPFAAYSNMSISQYTRLMCISYGVPGKDRVNFMSVFQIGVKLIAFQGERMGVVLGRLFDPRSHVKRRGELLLSTEEHGELFFYPRRDRRTSRVYRVFFGQLRGPARTGRTLPPQTERAELARTERR